MNCDLEDERHQPDRTGGGKGGRPRKTGALARKVWAHGAWSVKAAGVPGAAAGPRLSPWAGVPSTVVLGLTPGLCVCGLSMVKIPGWWFERSHVRCTRTRLGTRVGTQRSSSSCGALRQAWPPVVSIGAQAWWGHFLARQDPSPPVVLLTFLHCHRGRCSWATRPQVAFSSGRQK